MKMIKKVFISHSSADKCIADVICNHLESTGIQCWIAPRDIMISDWAGAIMDGLHQCNVFVVIISQNSIVSQEVLKEITEATRCCEYILPFKVDKYELNNRLKYHLGPCHWLDAITPPLEKRIHELEQRLLHLSTEDAVYLNPYRRKIVEKILWPQKNFVGREKELEEVAEYLQREKVVFLQGMGGIGKSEIAKAYAKTYREQYHTIVFANYTGSLLDMINSNEILIENLQRSVESESEEAFFYRKLQIMKDLSSEKTLFIIDNFDVEWDEKLSDVLNGPYHVLITTRYEQEDYTTIKIEKIQEFEHVRNIFLNSYGKKLSDEDIEIVDQILRLVDCHTITVELIAKQMKASRRKAKDMLALLKNTGTNTKLREKIRYGNEREGASAFDYICQMFQISGLLEEEVQILKDMCMMPHTGMDISQFYEICHLESYDEINSLLTKSWLKLDENTDILSIHPVIRDVVWEKLNPSIESCQRYVKGLWEISKDSWFMTNEDRECIAPYVYFILQKFPNPCPDVWNEYVSFVDTAWICGNFGLAQDVGKIVYQFTLEHFGSNTVQAGRMAMDLAGAYYNAGDIVSAEIYYKESLEHRLASLETEEDELQLAVSYSKMGRCAYLRHKFDEAKKYLEQALDIYFCLDPEASRENNCYSKKCGDTVVEIERMYMEMGEYEKALEINLQFRGEGSIQLVRNKEAIADVYVQKGEPEIAEKLYLELELELERNFGSENVQVKKLREKRNMLARK